MKLTTRQKEIYEYMQEYFIQYHHVPTATAIADHFEFKSINSANELVWKLVEKGYLERTTERRYKFTRFKVKLITHN